MLFSAYNDAILRLFMLTDSGMFRDEILASPGTNPARSAVERCGYKVMRYPLSSDVEHIRQSRPDSDLGFQRKFFETF